SMTRPMLVAKFVLDSNGAPQVSDQNDPPHYRVRLTVKNTPEDSYAVTYELHESYYEPVRESRSRADDFAEEITSFGDYEVRATVRGKHRNQTIVAELSEALTRGHSKEISSTIVKALRDIKGN